MEIYNTQFWLFSLNQAFNAKMLLVVAFIIKFILKLFLLTNVSNSCLYVEICYCLAVLTEKSFLSLLFVCKSFFILINYFKGEV